MAKSGSATYGPSAAGSWPLVPLESVTQVQGLPRTIILWCRGCWDRSRIPTTVTDAKDVPGSQRPGTRRASWSSQGKEQEVGKISRLLPAILGGVLSTTCVSMASPHLGEPARSPGCVRDSLQQGAKIFWGVTLTQAPETPTASAPPDWLGEALGVLKT